MFRGITLKSADKRISWLSIGLPSIFLIIVNQWIDASTRQPFWRTIVGMTLMLAAVFGVITTLLMIFNRGAPSSKQFYGELFFLLWLLSLGAALPLALSGSDLPWQDTPIAILTGATLACLLAVAYKLLKNKKYKLWKLTAAYGVVSIALLAWAR